MTIFLRFFVILLLLWCVLLAAFLGQVQQHTTPPTADAIVMLTGGKERLTTALGLLENNTAPRLFISGAHKDVRISELLHHTGAQVQAAQIELGSTARTTAENATEVARWVTAHNIRSIILVTSDYHMPRAQLELGKAITTATITPHTVQYATPTAYPLLLGEFHKWLVVLLGLRDAGVWIEHQWSE